MRNFTLLSSLLGPRVSEKACGFLLFLLRTGRLECAAWYQTRSYWAGPYDSYISLVTGNRNYRQQAAQNKHKCMGTSGKTGELDLTTNRIQLLQRPLRRNSGVIFKTCLPMRQMDSNHIQSLCPST